MRRPHRNIEIFSMSVLDMFASALGAFIMCAVILFPYFKPHQSEEVAAAQKALKASLRQVQAATEHEKKLADALRQQRRKLEKAKDLRDKLYRCGEETKICRAELAKNFLLVQIHWDPSDDVNLHVTDPKGHEFYWYKTNRNGRDFPSSKAKLSIDVRRGPGIEVWIDPVATPGNYLIDYHVSHAPKAPISVTGYFFDRYGRKGLPTKVIPSGVLHVHAATILVKVNGQVVLE